MRDTLYGKVYNATYDILDEGGPTCYNEMSLDFKLGATLLFMFLNIIFFNFGNKSFDLKYPKSKQAEFQVI